MSSLGDGSHSLNAMDHLAARQQHRDSSTDSDSQSSIYRPFGIPVSEEEADLGDSFLLDRETSSSDLAQEQTILADRAAVELYRNEDLWDGMRPESPTYASPQTVGNSIGEELPPEIIIQILSHIRRPTDIVSTLLVSRRWCRCAVAFIWSRPQISSDHVLRRLIRIINLSTGQRKDRINMSLGTTFPYHKLIKRLNFNQLQGRLQDEHLRQFRFCTAIDNLTLAGNKYLSPSAINAMLQDKSSLITADLSGTRTDDSVLDALSQTAKDLRALDLSGCHQFTEVGLKAIGNNLSLLKRLKLVHSGEIAVDGIAAVLRGCPNLLEIDLGGSSNLSDHTMICIWLLGPRLRELSLAGAEMITECGFPVLSELRFDASEAKPPNSPTGTTGSHDPASILEPPAIDYSLFRTVPRPIPRATSFDRLRTVDLNGCSSLTDKAIDALTWNARQIRQITLSKCGHLTDASLQSLTRLGRHLHHVHLGHVPLITDRGITQLARACNRLRYVDFAGDALLTDLSISELATNCSKLKRIGLVRVDQITDTAIATLVDRSDSIDNLERLHLSYCNNISVKAITYLLKNAPNLTHLSLTDVNAFKLPEMQRFAQPAPTNYNANQRAAFCVFSGRGVRELRNWLVAKETRSRLLKTPNTRFDWPPTFIPLQQPSRPGQVRVLTWHGSLSHDRRTANSASNVYRSITCGATLLPGPSETEDLERHMNAISISRSAPAEQSLCRVDLDLQTASDNVVVSPAHLPGTSNMAQGH